MKLNFALKIETPQKPTVESSASEKKSRMKTQSIQIPPMGTLLVIVCYKEVSGFIARQTPPE